jgi:hypothetical protein
MADYSDLYAAIGALLGKPETYWTPTPDALMVQIVAMQVPLWLAKIPCVTSPAGSLDYDDVEAANQPYVQNGFAVLISDILRGASLANSNDGRGAVIEEKAGSVTEKYAAGSSSATSSSWQTPSDAAVKAAWQMWALVECVAAAIAARPQAEVFGLAGREFADPPCASPVSTAYGPNRSSRCWRSRY